MGNKRRNFKFYDDGKDRGETWRHPIIKLQTGTGQLNAKFDEWYAENRHLEFDEAEKIWIKRLSDADLKPPGVPSDLLNYRYTGEFPSREAEYRDIVAAQRRAAKLTGADRAAADAEVADSRAADRIVKRHQPLALKIVFGDRKSKDPKKRKRYYGASDEDLVAIAQVGLDNALRDFNPDSGYRFSTYARTKIRSAIDDALRGTTDAERAFYAHPNATLDELVKLSGLDTGRFLERTYDICAAFLAKKAAEATMSFYDTIERGLPTEVRDTANFGDDAAPGRGDSDNTAFLDPPGEIAHHVGARDEETSIGPVLSDDDLADYFPPRRHCTSRSVREVIRDSIKDKDWRGIAPAEVYGKSKPDRAGSWKRGWKPFPFGWSTELGKYSRSAEWSSSVRRIDPGQWQPVLKPPAWDKQALYESWHRLYKFQCHINDFHSCNPADKDKPEQRPLSVSPFDKGMTKLRRREARAERLEEKRAAKTLAEVLAKSKRLVRALVKAKAVAEALAKAKAEGKPLAEAFGAALPKTRVKAKAKKRFDKSQQWRNRSLQQTTIRKEDAS